MVLRRIYRKLTGSSSKRRPHRTPKKLKKPRQRHPADTAPASGLCLLLQLPVEIRLRILGYTLCNNEAIQARVNMVSAFPGNPLDYSYYHDKVEYDEWPQGKPHLDILSTCRQLYREGADVFYNKNIFAITICDPGYGAYGNIDMLGMGRPQEVFGTHSRLRSCPNLKLFLYLGYPVTCTGMGYATSKDSMDDAIEQVYSHWQGHGRLEVEVYQKGRSWVDHAIGGPALLHKLGLFRCKSVWFRGVPYSIAYRLTQLIESDEPVVDLQQAFRDLTSYLDGSQFRDDSNESVFGEAYKDAERFAAFYEKENFMLLRKEVIELALKKMKANFDRLEERGLEIKGESLPVRSPGYLSDEYHAILALLNGQGF